MSQTAINAYRTMWLFVFFDLPTNTKTQRKRAAQFRKLLLKDGFGMLQYSVYIRHCASDESKEVHVKRIKASIPPEGYVSIVSITDKQYGKILNYSGAKSEPLKPPITQLEMF
jgi:CRISPR-associated protein Cas2